MLKTRKLYFLVCSKLSLYLFTLSGIYIKKIEEGGKNRQNPQGIIPTHESWAMTVS